MKQFENKLKQFENKKMRYSLENPHIFHVAIVDNLAPNGAKVVQRWNDKINLNKAKNLCDAMNYSWHIKRENDFLN